MVFKRLRNWIRTPSVRWGGGTLILGGILVGVLGWAGFSEVVTQTNSLEFCSSCHAMQVGVLPEYKDSVHFRNQSGVRAVCSDCHVPHATIPKLWRKFQATYNEIPHAVLGTIHTKENFEARRQQMAERVWATMKATDSRECRNCHVRDAMRLDLQKPRARGQHEDALKSGETCIDCHKGIAHHLPASAQPTAQPAADSEDFAL
ncbi:MAG: NapC/NirT family cytochrome c [Rhodanobacteraceae bacterium]|nr:NapC/NirT family cytochrome c [Rhodanobacteraceae bacterium]